MRAAFADLHAGQYGAIKGIRGFCFRDRLNIGKNTYPTIRPPGLDYDLWLGPAADLPMWRREFHYDWHWVWPTGNGDLGNQGIHQMDVARWGLGKHEFPKAVLASGGRFGYTDDGHALADGLVDAIVAFVDAG